MAMSSAAAWILAMNSSGKVVYWAGVTTTPISDGSTTNPVMINGSSVTIRPGGAVGYNGNEFVLSEDGVWQQFGETDVQHKTLDTPIDVDGTEVTTVEGALSAINEYAEGIEEDLETGLASQIDLLRDTVGWTGKNLLNPATLGLYDATGASAYRYGFAPITLKAGTYTFSYGSLDTSVNAYITNITNNYAQLSVPSDTKVLTFTLNVDSSIFVRTSASQATTITNAQLEAGSTATDYEPYHTSVNDTLRDAEVVEGKNKLQNIAVSTGIFTVNNDGTVTVNTGGTLAEQQILTISAPYTTTENMILNGTPSDGRDTTFSVYARDTNNFYYFDNYGEGVTIPSGKTITVCIVVRLVSLTGKVFKPMLRKATETDPTYEPYYIPLKDVVPTKLSYADNGVLGAHNLFTYPYVVQSGTVGTNTTYAVNDDGTITINGTPTTNSTFNLHYRKTSSIDLNPCILPKGDYIVSCPQRVRVDLFNTVNGNISTICYVASTESEKAFSLGEDTQIGAQVTVISGIAYVNEKIEITIRLVNDTYDKYTPYAQTNRELTVNKADNSVIGPVEDGANPTKSYAVGEHMIRGGKFCTVTVPVTTSSTWTLGGNYVEGDVAETISCVKGFRLGTFQFSTTTGVSAGNVTFNSPFPSNIDSTRIAVFLSTISGNSDFIFMGSVNNITLNGFGFLLKNISNELEANYRFCMYLAVAY